MKELAEIAILLSEQDPPKPPEESPVAQAEPYRSKPKKYHKHGGMPLTKVAKELGYSVGMIHWIEHEAMVKFAAAMFYPPWKPKHKELVNMKDSQGRKVQFGETGPFYETMADSVEKKLKKELGRQPTEDEFQERYEDDLITVSTSVDFRGQVRDEFVRQFMAQEEKT